MNLNAQGKFAAAQPLFEKALEIDRRLLTEEHPGTAIRYIVLAANLYSQRKYAEARPLFEKALEIDRRLLTDDHPRTADGYQGLATVVSAQGKHALAQPLFEKALEINRRLLADDHPQTADSYRDLGMNLAAQGKYLEARDLLQSAVNGLDTSRVLVAFSGLERAGRRESVRPALAAVLARLGQPAHAWQSLEDHMGRGLLDELTVRSGSRLDSAERARLRELTTALEQLDKLAETPTIDPDQVERLRGSES